MQAHADWQYINNQFETCSQNSHKKADIILQDHLAKLTERKNDPGMEPMRLRFEQSLSVFNQHYTQWLNQTGFYKASTERVDALLAQMPEKLARFDVLIQPHYMQGTPEYTTLFPRGRREIYSGGKDESVRLIGAFANVLGTYADLASVKTEVDAYVAELSSTRLAQQQEEQAIQHAAVQLKAAQKDAMKMMYRNLGLMMDLFADDPIQITNFFQLDVIRNVKGAGDVEDEEVVVEP